MEVSIIDSSDRKMSFIEINLDREQANRNGIDAIRMSQYQAAKLANQLVQKLDELED